MTLRPLRTRLALVLAALVAAAPLAVGGATATAATSTDVAIGPFGLPRGTDVAYPQVVDGKVVVGETRIDVPGTAVFVLGRAADHYVVATVLGGRDRIVSVAADRPAVLLPGGLGLDYFPTLSTDGERLLLSKEPTHGRSAVTVVDTDTGRRLGRHEFLGSAGALDAQGDRVLISHERTDATLEWDLTTGRVRRVADEPGFTASYRADRMATFSIGGEDVCTRVVVLSAPQTQVARTCRSLVLGFAPDGRMIRFDPRTFFEDENAYQIADPDGRLQATYRPNARSVIVYGLDWLDDGRVLFQVASRKRTALVACLRTACERVSALTPTDPLLFERGTAERTQTRRLAARAR